jgi:hypothetical protein
LTFSSTVDKRENAFGPEVDVVDAIVIFYFLLSSSETEMAWDGGVIISSAATAVTKTVNKTPFLRYLATMGGAMWLVERFRPARHGEKKALTRSPKLNE